MEGHHTILSPWSRSRSSLVGVVALANVDTRVEGLRGLQPQPVLVRPLSGGLMPPSSLLLFGWSPVRRLLWLSA